MNAVDQGWWKFSALETDETLLNEHPEPGYFFVRMNSTRDGLTIVWIDAAGGHQKLGVSSRREPLTMVSTSLLPLVSTTLIQRYLFKGVGDYLHLHQLILDKRNLFSVIHPVAKKPKGTFSFVRQSFFVWSHPSIVVTYPSI
jgi:hypothetical protein